MPALDGPQWAHIMGRMKAKDLANLPSIKYQKRSLSQVRSAIPSHIENARDMDDHEEDSATQGMSLYDSIKKHGVQRPVTVSRYSDGSYELSDGHHRVSSAMDIDPEMEIPVFFGITKIN